MPSSREMIGTMLFNLFLGVCSVNLIILIGQIILDCTSKINEKLEERAKQLKNEKKVK